MTRGHGIQWPPPLLTLLCLNGVSTALSGGPPCDTAPSSLRTSLAVSWVSWKKAPGRLDPARPANPAFGAVYANWQQRPPSFHGEVVTLHALQAFMRQLVAEDPFGMNGLAPRTALDQPGGYLSISQRQLAWLLVRCFLGDDTEDGSELSKAIRECSSSDQVHGILSMLAVLSIELRGGCQGAYIVAAKPSGQPGQVADSTAMAELSACLVQDGETLFGNLPCSRGTDFMQSNAPRQVVVDIAGANIGGGARLCNLASQDESLMQFFPEVMALSFFSHAMLHPPMVFFGARRYMDNYVGNGSPCGQIAALPDLLNEEILSEVSSALTLAGKPLPVYVQTLLAQQSRLNDYSIDNQITQWATTLSPDTLPAELLPLLCDLVHSVGTGPWGAGAWHGSSQWFLLATWLGTSKISAQLQQRCGHAVAMDYYVYDHFCENPLAQCSVCSYCEDPGASDRGKGPTCTADSCSACKGGGGELGRVQSTLQRWSYGAVRGLLNSYNPNAFSGIPSNNITVMQEVLA